MIKKTILITVIVLNSIVLLGQLWPAGTPPFARMVNIVTMVLNLLIFIMLLKKNINISLVRKTDQAGKDKR
jgi:hypothetical protein